LREGREETGLDAGRLTPRWWSIADHKRWSYTTFCVDATDVPPQPEAAIAGRDAGPGGAASREDVPGPFVGPSNWETEALVWVEPDEVAGYDLHPGLAESWPTLRPWLDQRLALIVDAANVVGSRPDGWWHDRAGAAERLRDQLEPLAAAGMANVWSPAPNGWFPEVTLVVEGQARGIGQGQGVRVVAAPGIGDDTIADLAARAVTAKRGPVKVVTADRDLIARSRRAGAGVLAPRPVLSLIGPADG
jgi:hypothetical protein